MAELFIFLVSYATVFALGFQSRNVNDGHYILAFCTNAVIGVMNVIALKIVPSSESLPVLLAYVAGGPLGIVSAMYVHQRFVRRRK